MGIIIFLAILAFLILAHEFGHFVVAKSAGIRVDEFGIGFPPRLFGFKRGETLYSVNAIPFGGFVKIYGEDGLSEEGGKERERSFVAQSRFTQLSTLGAGIAFNIFLGWFLISLLFLTPQPSLIDDVSVSVKRESRVEIEKILAGSPAEAAGLKPGDTIVRLFARENVFTPSEERAAIVGVHDFIVRNSQESINVVVEREGEKIEFSAKPVIGIVEDSPAIGFAMREFKTPLPFHLGFIEGGKATFELSGIFAVGTAQFIANAVSGNADFSQVTGPVGIVAIGSEAAGLGLPILLSFAAIISINLAVINLLPFPALDGGRMFFSIIEFFKRSPISPRFTHLANTLGFGVLILMMLAVTYNDITKLF